MVHSKSERLFVEALKYVPGGVNSLVRTFRVIDGQHKKRGEGGILPAYSASLKAKAVATKKRPFAQFADCLSATFSYNQHPMLHSIFKPIVAWYLTVLKTGGYPLIVLLMTMESSFLPLPGEVIIPPAAHLAWTGNGLNFFSFHFSGWLAQILIVITGAFGSWLGATIMYWLARVAGRPLVLRYGRLILFPPEKLEKAERWMSHYGPMSVFIARLLPGARQLVGIPAGIARMNYKLFSIFTLLGATIWCVVLCWLGVRIGADITKGEMRRVMLWLAGTALVLGGLYYFFVHRQLQQKPEAGNQKSE